MLVQSGEKREHETSAHTSSHKTKEVSTIHGILFVRHLLDVIILVRRHPTPSLDVLAQAHQPMTTHKIKLW